MVYTNQNLYLLKDYKENMVDLFICLNITRGSCYEV
jgi:hypothetical protein